MAGQQSQSRIQGGSQGSQGGSQGATQGGSRGESQAGSQQAAPPKKPRRPAAKRYAVAARERRLQQEYNNYHHPPKEEDIWVCEFCEYESIFGRQPEALVRQYEIKDRRERQRLAEKKRLLEKAKMKGRKGKKANKAATKNNPATTQSQQPAQTYQGQADQMPLQNHGTQSDEYYADDYDDHGPSAMPAPETPTRIPQPVSHGYGHSTRSTHSIGDGSGRA